MTNRPPRSGTADEARDAAAPPEPEDHVGGSDDGNGAAEGASRLRLQVSRFDMVMALQPRESYLDWK